MKSLATSDFWQAYRELSPAIKRQAKKAEGTLRERVWGDVRSIVFGVMRVTMPKLDSNLV